MPTVALPGELDAAVGPAQPCADERSGTAHACGSNAQVAAMLGAGHRAVRQRSDEPAEWAGDVYAVPAEEFVELEYRQKLRRKGKMDFIGGKQQLLSEGAFDDVDMAMMAHSHCADDMCSAVVGAPSSGFVGKIVLHTGREAHTEQSRKTG